MHLLINRESSETLIRQVYNGIKTNILTGNLGPGQKLPSTRLLAKNLQLSRNVVLEAYDQLFVEGYIEASKGSGSYVSKNLMLENYKTGNPLKRKNLFGLKNEPQKDKIDFRTGVPNLSLFPKEKWGMLYKKVCEELPACYLDYYEPGGCYELRFELASYLRRVRGVCCFPEEIIITTGAAQAFNLLAKYFSDINKEVIVEDPISHGILDILNQNQMSLHPVPVDDLGINTDLLPKSLNPSLIFTTPSHQFPMGCLLPANRRLELIRFARQKDAYIIEDDYDSEFKFEGSPVASMQSLDSRHVIYIGTFSKMLCPALRLGYMIVPPLLVDVIKNMKYNEDIHSPILEQLTLAEFIKNGSLDTHIRKSKKFYHQRSEFVIETLKTLFKERVEIKGNHTGIHLVARFEEIDFNEELLIQLERNGLKINTVEKHVLLKGKHNHEILIGYGHLTEKEVTEGLNILFKTLYPYN